MTQPTHTHHHTVDHPTPCPGPRPECKWCAGDPTRMTCDRNCSACPVRCCTSYSYLDHLLAPVEPERLPGLEIDLPPFIPQVDRPGQSHPAVLVAPDKLFLRHWHTLRLRWGGDYRHLNPDGLIGAHFYTRDNKLETIWGGYELAFWQRLKRAGFDFIIGPNFSIWNDDPSFEWAYNLKRAQLLSQKMARLGLPLIPDVIGPVERWADLLPERGWVALNLGYFTRATWPDALERVTELDQRLAEPVGLLINGIGSRRRYEDLLAAVPKRRLSIVNRAWQWKRGSLESEAQKWQRARIARPAARP